MTADRLPQSKIDRYFRTAESIQRTIKGVVEAISPELEQIRKSQGIEGVMARIEPLNESLDIANQLIAKAYRGRG